MKKTNGNNTYTDIDIDNWDRKDYCLGFKQLMIPVMAFTIELDITLFLKKIKKKNLSFTLSMCYASALCASKIDAFRYRFLNDDTVAFFDNLDTRFSYLAPEDKYYREVTAPLTNSLEEYVKNTKQIIENQAPGHSITTSSDFIRLAPISQFTYVSVSHTINGNYEDSIPIIGWGKYFERDGKIILPYTIKVHHSFVDGADIGMFIETLKKFLEEC